MVAHKHEERYVAQSPTEMHDHLAFIDANSLYSVGLQSALPIGNFQYLTQAQIEDFDMDYENWDLNGPKVDCALVEWVSHSTSAQTNFYFAGLHLYLGY